MKRRLAFFALLLFLVPAAYAELGGCERSVPDDLYAYKDEYVPVVFAPEPFGMEVADLAVLSLVLVVAAFFSLKRLPFIWTSMLMLVGLTYFGIVRGGCICPVGATTNVVFGLAAPELVGKLIAVLFLLPLIFTFFVGRVFCSSACPLGAIQHLLARKRFYELPKRLNAWLRLLPLFVLFATVWGALRGGMFIACKLDVYRLAFFSGYAWLDQLLLLVRGGLVEPHLLLVGDLAAWLALFFALLLGAFVPRPFCRFVCPYGVLLGSISVLGFRRRRVDTAGCINCRRCATLCPVQAISTSAAGTDVVVSRFHCIECGRCAEACKVDAIAG